MDFDPRDHANPRDGDGEGIYGSRWAEDVRKREGVDPALEPHDHDPRDPFVHSVDLPRGVERELVQDLRERLYELNGDESRMLATIGAFRVVSEHDLDAFRSAGESLEHLREEELIRSVPIGHDEEAVVLTDRGWERARRAWSRTRGPRQPDVPCWRGPTTRAQNTTRCCSALTS